MKTKLFSISIILALIVHYFFNSNSFTTFFYLLLNLKLIIIIRNYIIRKEALTTSQPLQKIISLLSTFTPFFYEITQKNEQFYLFKIIFYLGFLLSIIGLINLGASFSIVPEKRVKVSTGIYKYLNHPIYTGYFLSELALTLMNLDIHNILIFIISISLYYYRAKKEAELFSPVYDQKIYL